MCVVLLLLLVFMLLSIIMFVVITQLFCCWVIVYALLLYVSYIKCLYKWCKICIINDSSQLSMLTIDSKLRSCSPVSFVTAIETISTYSTLPLSSLSKEIKKIYHFGWQKKKQVLRYTSLDYDIPNTRVINGFLYSTSDTKITAVAPAILAFCAYNTIIQSVNYTSQISHLFKYSAVAFVLREVHQNSITSEILCNVTTIFIIIIIQERF